MQIHVSTPLWESPPLSTALGAPVLLKMEALQPTGCFKARGMGAACAAAAETGATHLVCASGGNAGLAVAYAGRKLGLQVTIIVPKTTPDMLRDLIAREGAHILVHGDAWDDTHVYATELSRREGAEYIHPFDDPRIWSGHATMIQEIAEEGVRPGIVVVSVGGGGLMCGILEGMHRVGWTDVPVLAVETEGTASLAAAVREGRLVTLERIEGIATTLGARTVAAEALAWTRRHPVLPWVVTDRSALDASLRFADDHRILVEPSCGASLAAGYERAEPLAGPSPVLFIVCGGAGVSRALLDQWDREVAHPT